MKTKNLNLKVSYSIINDNGTEFPRAITMNVSRKKDVYRELAKLIDDEVDFVVTNMEIV